MSYRIVLLGLAVCYLASAREGFAQQKRQTISFPQPLVVRVGDKPLKLEARATSKLPVRYFRSNKSVAKVDGSWLVILRAGNTTVTATQAGNKRFLAAKPVKRIVVVSKRRKPKPVPAPAPTALIKVQGGKLPAGSELAGTSVASFQIGR